MGKKRRRLAVASSVSGEMNRSFSAIVAQQGRLVERQEKATQALEARAKKVVARAQKARLKADGVERSAVKVLKESGRG